MALLLESACPFQSDRAKRRQRRSGEFPHAGSAQRQGAYRPQTKPKDAEPTLLLVFEHVRINEVRFLGSLAHSRHRVATLIDRRRESIKQHDGAKFEHFSYQRCDHVAWVAVAVKEQNPSRS